MIRKRTHRFVALLCVFCMLFTSIPSSVMSDSSSATPTDLEPVVQEKEEQPKEQDAQEQDTPEQETEKKKSEKKKDPAEKKKSEKKKDRKPKENKSGQENAEATEAPATEAPKTPADRDLKIGDVLTINGTKEGKKDYLVRFTPAESRSMYLILSSDKKIKATVTNEATGATKKFKSADKDENGR